MDIRPHSGAFFMAGHSDIAELHDIAREMLLEYRTELEHRWKAGDKSSNLKRVREKGPKSRLPIFKYITITYIQYKFLIIYN